MMLIALVFCVFVGFVRLVYAILPIPLDYLFLIAPSSFSNVSYKKCCSLANFTVKYTIGMPAVTKGSGASFRHEGRFGGHRKPGK